MKEQYHSSHGVQVHQILAFGAHLLRPNGIGAGGCERATTAWNIEAVVSNDLELAREKRVGGFLQSAVRAGDYQRVWSRGSPSELGFGWIGGGQCVDSRLTVL